MIVGVKSNEGSKKENVNRERYQVRVGPVRT